jgi:hypothetical protein
MRLAGSQWESFLKLGLKYSGGRISVTHVWSELQVGFTTLNVLLVGVIQVTVNDLLSKGERTV